MKPRTHSVRMSFLVLIFVANVAGRAMGQCVADDAGILNARYAEGQSSIYVSLTSRVNMTDLQTTGAAAQWNLIDITATPSVNVTIIGVKPTGLLNNETTSVTLSFSGPLNVNHEYMLAAPHLTFLGCKPKDGATPRTVVKIRLTSSATPPISAPSTPEKHYFPRGKAEDRNDSNFYLSGSIEGAKGGKAQYSADIKIEIPYVLSDSGNFDVRPYFNLKTSTAEDADPDSMNFGGKFAVNFFNRTSGPVRYLLFTPAAGFEADTSFENVNLLTSQVLTFGIPGNKHTFKKRVRILPFIGYEVGRNVKSPVKEGEDRTISRGLVGATFYAAYDRTEDSGISFQLDYIRRFLLAREISFEKDDNDKFVPLAVGKGPRDYLKATAEYSFSKFAGLALSYEYGRLPPNFELVNHKYSLGLVVKFKTKFGAE